MHTHCAVQDVINSMVSDLKLLRTDTAPIFGYGKLERISMVRGSTFFTGVCALQLTLKTQSVNSLQLQLSMVSRSSPMRVTAALGDTVYTEADRADLRSYAKCVGMGTQLVAHGHTHS